MPSAKTCRPLDLQAQPAVASSSLFSPDTSGATYCTTRACSPRSRRYASRPASMRCLAAAPSAIRSERGSTWCGSNPACLGSAACPLPRSSMHALAAACCQACGARRPPSPPFTSSGACRAAARPPPAPADEAGPRAGPVPRCSKHADSAEQVALRAVPAPASRPPSRPLMPAAASAAAVPPSGAAAPAPPWPASAEALLASSGASGAASCPHSALPRWRRLMSQRHTFSQVLHAAEVGIAAVITPCMPL